MQKERVVREADWCVVHMKITEDVRDEDQSKT